MDQSKVSIERGFDITSDEDFPPPLYFVYTVFIKNMNPKSMKMTLEKSLMLMNQHLEEKADNVQHTRLQG